jgi:hypothetical protein
MLSVQAMLTIPDVRAIDAGTYVCTARNRNVKMDIPTVLVVTGVVPYFAQAPTSFMALPTLPDAYLQFNIEVSFKPESSDGKHTTVFFFEHIIIFLDFRFQYSASSGLYLF